MADLYALARLRLARAGVREVHGGGFCTYHCTMATAAADCPAPSTGCNNMGICKVP